MDGSLEEYISHIEDRNKQLIMECEDLTGDVCFLKEAFRKLSQKVDLLRSENIALKTRLEIALAQAEGREPDVEAAINQ